MLAWGGRGFRARVAFAGSRFRVWGPTKINLFWLDEDNTGGEGNNSKKEICSNLPRHTSNCRVPALASRTAPSYRLRIASVDWASRFRV